MLILGQEIGTEKNISSILPGSAHDSLVLFLRLLLASCSKWFKDILKVTYLTLNDNIHKSEAQEVR